MIKSSKIRRLSFHHVKRLVSGYFFGNWHEIGPRPATIQVFPACHARLPVSTFLFYAGNCCFFYCHPHSARLRQARQALDSRLTAPFGCMAFLVVFLLLTAFIIWLFSFFTTGPMVEDLAFTLAWLAAMACALAVISRLTEYCLQQDKSASKLYPGESRKLLPVQLRNKGILLFVLIGVISCVIDIITVPFPVPELPPGSALSAATLVPLPQEVPVEVHISSRVTNRFFGECDFDLTVREKGGNKHVFPAILINPGGERRHHHLQAAAGGKTTPGQLDIHQWHAKLPVQHGYHADEVPERSPPPIIPHPPGRIWMDRIWTCAWKRWDSTRGFPAYAARSIRIQRAPMF